MELCNGSGLGCMRLVKWCGLSCRPNVGRLYGISLHLTLLRWRTPPLTARSGPEPFRVARLNPRQPRSASRALAQLNNEPIDGRSPRSSAALNGVDGCHNQLEKPRRANERYIAGRAELCSVASACHAR